ncbi:MAG TPA: GntR family transcriptional regulator [Casimicrobiaceae bacterium]|nr:GntR family transcriptional regulator [Casimicrobiaceae bacterium]
MAAIRKAIERREPEPTAPGGFLTLSQQLVRRIADEIVNERFTPGARLKEVELASMYRVSRTSVREALRVLENRGLVRIEPRRGVHVTQLSAEEVDDLYEIRASLLAVAARRVAMRRSADLADELRGLLVRVTRHATDADHNRYFAAVYALSQLIADGAGSERLATLIRSFSQQIARYTRMSLRSPARRQRSAQRWKVLVAAIEAGNAAKADEAMRRLVTASQESIRQILLDQAHKRAA